MKTAIVCYNCLKPKKFSDSYAVKITNYTKPIQYEGLIGGSKKDVFDTLKVRVCRTCVKRMGYKIKKPKQNGKTV